MHPDSGYWIAQCLCTFISNKLMRLSMSSNKVNSKQFTTVHCKKMLRVTRLQIVYIFNLRKMKALFSTIRKSQDDKIFLANRNSHRQSKYDM